MIWDMNERYNKDLLIEAMFLALLRRATWEQVLELQQRVDDAIVERADAEAVMSTSQC